MINKDTKLYGSFARKAGSRGCKIFNNAFRYHDLNSIYKSFSIESIEEGVSSARCLGFHGFAVTMPFKSDVLNFVDIATDEVLKIGAANTVIRESTGAYKAYNTDYIAAFEYIKKEKVHLSHINMHDTILNFARDNVVKIFVLGDGGYARAVKYALGSLHISFENIKRKNWKEIGEIENSIIYNCTPVKNIAGYKNCAFIDCDTSTLTGRKLGMIQASHQYRLYTGLNFPFNYNS